MTSILVSLSLPDSPNSAARARHFVEQTLREWQFDSTLIETATLLTSELVTNALVHAASAPRLEMQLCDHVVRIEVADQGDGRAEIREVSVDALHGRGLQIVDALAQRWGDEHRSGGEHVVWFEIAAALGLRAQTEPTDPSN